MSGRDENSEPVEAVPSEHGEQAFLRFSPAPPSFGHAAVPTVTDDPPPAPRSQSVAASSPSADGTTAEREGQLDAPWWMRAASSAPGDTLVAGPGTAAAGTSPPPPPWLGEETGTAVVAAGTEVEISDSDDAPLLPDAILPPGTSPESLNASVPLVAPAADEESSAAAHGGVPGSGTTAAPGVPMPPPRTAQTPPPHAPGAGAQASAQAATQTTPQPASPVGSPSGPQPAPQTSPQAPPQVIAPLYHSEGGVPPIDHGPPAGATATASGGGSGGGRSKGVLLAVGGTAAAVLVGAVVFAAFTGDSTPAKTTTGGKDKVAAATPPAPAPTASAPASPSAPPTRSAVAVSPIDNWKTDSKSLTMREVFPDPAVSVAGQQWKQDKASLNQDCALAARGAMATALRAHDCNRVVRATYVNRAKEFAVTTGIAVLPTKADALAIGKAGDPGRYEWFRGMQGTVAKEIDQAGGYASSTVRGRYVIYAYAQYLDGPKAAVPPAKLRDLTLRFIDYAVRPIEERAR